MTATETRLLMLLVGLERAHAAFTSRKLKRGRRALADCAGIVREILKDSRKRGGR
jgi:hypothetical protein